jgi:hypothetical protein
LIAFARSRNVGKIVVGKTERPRWKEVLFGSFIDNLIRESGDIDIYVVRGDEVGVGVRRAPHVTQTLASLGRPSPPLALRANSRHRGRGRGVRSSGLRSFVPRISPRRPSSCLRGWL